MYSILEIRNKQGCDRLLKKKTWTTCMSTKCESSRAWKLAGTNPVYMHLSLVLKALVGNLGCSVWLYSFSHQIWKYVIINFIDLTWWLQLHRLVIMHRTSLATPLATVVAIATNSDQPIDLTEQPLGRYESGHLVRQAVCASKRAMKHAALPIWFLQPVKTQCCRAGIWMVASYSIRSKEKFA